MEIYRSFRLITKKWLMWKMALNWYTLADPWMQRPCELIIDIEITTNINR